MSNGELILYQTEDGQTEIPPEPGDILRYAKADQRGDDKNAVSGLTGQGVQKLIEDVTAQLANRAAQSGIALRLRALAFRPGCSTDCASEPPMEAMPPPTLMYTVGADSHLSS